MDPKLYRQALGHFLSGVTVVTAERDHGEGPTLHGMTASAFVSVSLDPPLVLVAVQKKAHTHAVLAEGGPFAISILAQGQDKVSNHFAGWKDPAFTPATERARCRTPVIAGALCWLDLDLHQAVDAGDHTLFIGRVVDLAVADPAPADGLPLAYYRGGYGVYSRAGGK